MNQKELRAEMIRKDKDIDYMCAAIGISRTSWFRKIKGETMFTQGEISKIRNELDLDDQKTILIFF